MLTNIIATAYCACAICCGPKAPGQRGITASGTYALQGVTLAAPRSVPFGSPVIIGTKIYTVEDRTVNRIDGWDLYFRKHEDAILFGKQRLRIWVGQ